MSVTRLRRVRFITMLVAGGMVPASCASGGDDAGTDSNGGAEPTRADGSLSAVRGSVFRYPPAPASPAADAADAPDVRAAMNDLGAQLQVGEIDEAALANSSPTATPDMPGTSLT